MEMVSLESEYKRMTAEIKDLQELLKDAWGIIMDVENYDPVPGYRVDDFLSGYELVLKKREG